MTNLQTMYPAVNNSPQVSLTGNITAAAAQVPLSSAAALPAAPGLVTIGVDDDAELIRYNGISGNTLTGCERGFSGTTARVWEAGEAVYRAFTAYDHDAFKANIEALNSEKVRIYTTEAEPDDTGAFIWLQPAEAGVGLLALGASAGDGLNVTVDAQTLAVTNAEVGAGGGEDLSYTIR